MNAFYEHHQDSIAMHYACFDRMVLDARIPAFLDGARAMGFFSRDRGLFPVHKNHLVKISTDYEKWVREQVQSSQCPLLEDPEERIATSSWNRTLPPHNRTRLWASSKRGRPACSYDRRGSPG